MVAIGSDLKLRKDFLASIVVFLVALPLCLGIAIASGLPPMLGIVTGVIGGLLVGSISGAPLMVSGPAAGLVALVAQTVETYQLEGLSVVMMLAGSFQISCGMLRLGQWFRAISPAVIEGMLAGIGVLIMVSQFHVMLDVTPESNGLANILTIPDTIRKGLYPTTDSVHHWAAMFGIITIGVLLGWKMLPKKVRIIPGMLVAVLVAVSLSAILHLPIRHVDIPHEIWSSLTLPTSASLSLLQDINIWVIAATMALVASAESMLSASATDRMHSGSRTEYNREMIAQGMGNTLCGFLGALPLTGVIVRSSANIQAGAKSRLSTILHGIWILAMVSFFPHGLEMIPTACLAAILVYTGFNLVNPAGIRELWHVGRGEVLIYGTTMLMVVCTSLLEGVVIGMVLATLRLLYNLSRLTSSVVVDEQGHLSLTLQGSASFLSLPRLISILESQPLGRTLAVNLDELHHIDQACIEQLRQWEAQYINTGGSPSVEWHTLNSKCLKKTTAV